MYDLLVIVYLDCREEEGTWRIAVRDAVSFPEWGLRCLCQLPVLPTEVCGMGLGDQDNCGIK